MRSTSSHGKLTLGELALLSVMAALIFASKIALAALPNIHLVGVLLVLCAIHFGGKAFYTVAVYVMLEGLVFGFGDWWFAYLYTWPLLVLLALPLRKSKSWLLYALLTGVFGLVFGALCALVKIVLFGWQTALTWWLAGIPYDLIHAGSNFVLTLILLPPLDKLFEKLTPKLRK